ncbi:MAG TPA: ATP-binding protein [Fimbriiglobus sp.]|jgi:signal transduction histidine kinase
MTRVHPETVLILEDDKGVALLQERRLERAGYAVVVTATPEQALARVRAGGVDLLLVDQRLSPAEDGLGFFDRLRADGFDLPVILVTGYSDDATVIRALRAGVKDYVFKSAEYLDYLPEAVGRVLAQVRVQREKDRVVAALHAKTEELKSTTRQLWQAARLAGVGELAASIAHELNNPLGTVSLRIEGVLAKTAADDPRRKALEVIDQEVARMARLVGNLLQFSRAGRDQVSTVDVRDELGKTIELTEHHLTRTGVRIEPDYDAEAPVIFADRQHLRQVFLNLLTNAGDAMPGGGRLTVRVRPGRLAARPAVVVEVADTGVGIPPEHLARVTDPFFTTKDEGKGTGLGLAICKRIVSQHGGRLDIDSTVGQGTTVRITLPAKSDANVAGLGPG